MPKARAEHNQDLYLRAVVDQFRGEAAELTGYELRKKLWRACVVVCEVTPEDYRDWHLTLCEIAFQAGVKPTEAITTVKSARRKAGVAL